MVLELPADAKAGQVSSVQPDAGAPPTTAFRAVIDQNHFSAVESRWQLRQLDETANYQDVLTPKVDRIVIAPT